jgi:hypothetical protein
MTPLHLLEQALLCAVIAALPATAPSQTYPE